MAVDEFGREIPAGRARRDRGPSPSPPADGGAPHHLYGALPTSRYNADRSTSTRKRKHRSESPPPRSRKASAPHPSTLYAEEPMLCQFLWKEANPDKSDKDYDDYRKSYCLNYVRTFFNEHMDDSWFRAQYSPLGKYRAVVQDQGRAAKEAQTFRSELEASLQKQTTDKCYFVLKARLGGGVKQPRKLPGDDYHHNNSPAKKPAPANHTPVSHVLSLSSKVLPIKEVPPHVTDEQLMMALMLHCNTTKHNPPLVIYSSSPSHDLSRTAFLLAPDNVRKDIVNQLNNLDRGAAAAPAGADATHVPRKEESFLPKSLELIVECSDPYGRLEIDADGKGGAPEEEGAVPPRKASVWVSTVPVTPNVVVLSAAVSSKRRMAQDYESAFTLAKAHDVRRNISQDCRLETLITKAIPSTETPQDKEDALDFVIAYLRRVHLLSFYNGCASAPNVADVLSGHHATSTIHLRLANADDILHDTKGGDISTPADANTPAAKKDLLEQRLEDSIKKAMDLSAQEEGNVGSIIDQETDKDAKDIERAENGVQDGWKEDHAAIDEDGRARCSFHFCRKLFKDSSFLAKHLMKKHCEFLRAEIAKSHDSYMMKSWDLQVTRPVPPILVDCGRALGTQPSPVIGAEPMVADPEPGLWKRQEDRRKMEEEEEMARRERYNPEQSLNEPLHEDRPPPRAQNFVDVDDMKEEKVEMSFDNVEIPMEPPKKKKKKKKLL